MKLLTFNEILTKLCDDFDILISPRTIARSNTNIIYLIFKAVAKGFELINNICVILNNKFDPSNCSVEDLDSISAMVGTNRLQGSASGLHIIVTNITEEEATLLAGTYYYALDDNTTFYFEVLEDTVISGNSYITLIAMSENIGSYAVTAQSKLIITSTVIIPNALEFSCQDNSNLLGTAKESDYEFRKRILSRTDNQDTIIELENTLKNLPYLFDCRCKFNQTVDTIDYDGILIPPFSLAVFFSGMPKNEIANIIASHIICPTVVTDDSVELIYENKVFVGDKYKVNIIPFGELLFDVNIILHIDINYVSETTTKAEMTKALNTALIGTVHKDYVKEDDVYTVLNNLNIAGVNVLGVNLIYNEVETEYIIVPSSKVPKIHKINFIME